MTNRLWMLVPAGALACAFQSGSAAPAPAGQTAPDAQSATVHPDIWPQLQYPNVTTPAQEARVEALLRRMTLEEKVGQVLQADLDSVTPEDVKKYHLGSVLNGGSSGPGGNDLAPAREWLALADRFYEASVDTSDGGVGIPVIWGIDAVHGHSNIVGATLFPHNIGLGAAQDPDLIEKIGRATAIEIRVTGQEWTFAPTVTVPQDYRWGRAYEGYSSNPDLVASYVGRMVLGLQGPPNAGPMLKGPYVLASTKHFLADGGTYEGRDQGDARISEELLRDIHAKPYKEAIAAGVATVMTSFSSWQGVKIAGNKGLVTDILKGRFDFGGFVVTDWNAHGQIAGCTNASCPKAIDSGVDMYMAPDSWRALYASLIAQVKDGTVPMARLDDAVKRILRVKMRLGLFEAGKPSSRPYSGRYDLLGAADHRALARQAVRESLVLLKNAGSLLPLKSGAKVLVAGDAADDVARASGGWTLSWQGTGLTNKDFPGATTIWSGIREAVGAAGGTATLSPDGSFAAKPDVAIVVFGETPYAEFQGDIKSLQLRRDLRQIEVMRKLKAAGIPVVAVMLTGRPLFVNPELNAADAFVVAWLPGSEGEGVADMLFRGADGTARRFTGKLPTAWPANARADGPTLFPFGFGLTGGEAPTAWKPLSEDAGVAAAEEEGVYFNRGTPVAPWSLSVGDGRDLTRITTVPAQALGGRVRVTAVNTDIQEGARRFAMAGGAPQVVEIAAAPVDLLRETNGLLNLVVTMRVDQAPGGPVSFAARCGSECSGSVAAPEIATLPVGRWTTIGIPLRCLQAGGADMARIEAPFELRTEARFTFSLSRVALGTEAERMIACP